MGDAHLAAPHDLPALVSRHAARLGVLDAVVFLADLQQSVLVPFVGSADLAVSRQVETLGIDSTLAGRAFQLVEVLTQPADAAASSTRVWLPLLNGTERVGVMAVTVPRPEDVAAGDGALLARLRLFASIVAELTTTKTMYGDAIVRARRLAHMGLAAEIQWALLPPLTFASSDVVVAAALEPAYEVAGDSVDYAVDAGCTRTAVFDGMGHGLQSAQLASLAVAAYRNARRAGRSLTTTAAAVDEAMVAASGGEAFTTAVLAELDTTTGALSWVNAGHPEPLLLRENRLVKALQAPPGLPFGLGLPGSGGYDVGREQLQRGDIVLFLTDGVIEARSPDGEFFGVDRLVDLATRSLAGDLPAPETMRRLVHALLEHQQGQLTDDATLLLLQWSGDEQRLLPQEGVPAVR